MSGLIKIYRALSYTMNVPTNFGTYHLACIALVIVLSIAFAAFLKNKSDRTVNRFVLCVWMLLVILEVYKQLIYGFELENSGFVWDYAWYAFPFQFCSSPLYILPIICFVQNEKLRDGCIAYMITFSFFAGLAVFCYPNDVFTETVWINIQTMVHHGSQILMGIVLAVRYKGRMTVKFFMRGVSVFVVMSSLAMILNLAVYELFLIFGIDETFNMFYISPHFDCTLPILSIIYAKVAYPLFLAIYLLGFTAAAGIVFGVLSKLISVEKEVSCDTEMINVK